MRSDIEDNEFLYECKGIVKCDVTHTRCKCDNCRYCDIGCNQQKKLVKSINLEFIDFDRKTNGDIEFLRNCVGTIALFKGFDDAVSMFKKSCFDYKRIDYHYTPRMLFVYPLFFRLKALLSLGVPIRLLHVDYENPLFAIYGDGVYVIAPRIG